MPTQPPETAASPAAIPPLPWKRILLETWKDAGADNLSLIAAGVAFYAFLALVPFLTALVLSYGLIADPASVVSHMQGLTSVMPGTAASIVGDQLQAMTETSGAKTGFALVLALGIAIYGASKAAGAIMTALNIVFEVEESRSFVHRTLLALVMTAGAVLSLFLAVLAISALHVLEDLLPGLGGVPQVLLKAVFFLLASGAVATLIALIYRYGPNRPDAPWRWITPGSAVATIVWLAATLGFGVYVSNFSDYNATYGSLGAVIVFLTWLYLSAYILLFGAELNSIMEAEVAGAPARQAAPVPVRSDPAPSFAKVVAGLGLFSALAAMLGRPRRIAG
jgi:membrane protein